MCFVEIRKHHRGSPELRHYSSIPGRHCRVPHPSDRATGMAEQEGTPVTHSSAESEALRRAISAPPGLSGSPLSGEKLHLEAGNWGWSAQLPPNGRVTARIGTDPSGASSRERTRIRIGSTEEREDGPSALDDRHGVPWPPFLITEIAIREEKGSN